MLKVVMSEPPLRDQRYSVSSCSTLEFASVPERWSNESVKNTQTSHALTLPLEDPSRKPSWLKQPCHVQDDGEVDSCSQPPTVNPEREVRRKGGSALKEARSQNMRHEKRKKEKNNAFSKHFCLLVVGIF